MGAGRQAALIVNSGARGGVDALTQVREALTQAGVALGMCAGIEQPDKLAGVIEQAVEAGHGPIIIGGGDGSLSAAADVLARRRAILGLIPLGTANDFAHTLGIPPTLEEACAIIARGTVVEVDLGLVSDTNHYLNQASIGLVGDVTDMLPRWLKRLSGPLAYPISTAAAFARYKPFDAELSFPAGDHPSVKLRRLLHLAVGNGRYYGGGMVAAPGANPDDGLLDVAAIRLGRWRELFSIAAALRSGEYVHRRGVQYYRTTAIEIRTGRPMTIVADGEPACETPCHVAIAPAALRVLAPHPRQRVVRRRHERKPRSVAS